MTRSAAAIIAGGLATRLGGVAKPFLRIGGRTIAERQLEVLRPMFDRVLVVSNDPAPWAPLGVEVVPDRLAGLGPLGGVEAALAVVRPDGHPVVCVAGDLPFLSPPLLAALRDRSPGAPALAPRPRNRIEPLCARYGPDLWPVVSARARAGELALHALLAQAGAAWLDDPELGELDREGRTFFNVNDTDDLRRAEALARQPSP